MEEESRINYKKSLHALALFN